MTGVTRGPDGIKRYDGLPRNLVHMLRASVERQRRRGGRRRDRRRPPAELRRAVGPRRPGGRRAARPRRPARRPGGDPAGQRRRLGAGLLRRRPGRRHRRCRSTPGSPRAKPATWSPTPARRTCSCRAPRCPTATPLVVDDQDTDRPGGDLLHQRHHGLPQGRGDQPRELPVQRRDLPPRAVRWPCTAASLRTLISVPLFHVTGCNSQLLLAMYTGGTAVIMPGLRGRRVPATPSPRSGSTS